MDRVHLPLRRRAACVALALALLVPVSGCQIVIGTLLMLRGRDMTECEYRKQAQEKLSGKDKKVVILCSVPDSAREEYGGLDIDIITHVSRSLESTGVRVADSQRVATWMDSYGVSLTNVPLVEVAEKFKANRVMLIHFEQFSFREENSPGMFRGRARGNISVTRIDDEKGVKTTRRVFTTVITSNYPTNQPISATEREASTFRLEYVQRVGAEIGRLFHDYFPEDAFSG